MGAFQEALKFLVGTLFDLYITIVALRVIFYALRVDYFNPLTQFVLKLTNPVVMPIQKFIPNIKRFELATITLAILLAVIKVYLLALISGAGLGFNPIGVLLVGIGEIISLVINVFFFAIIIQAVLSWLAPQGSPIGPILYTLTNPVLAPLRRFIPPIAGFDLTPIFGILALMILNILISKPIITLGAMLMV